MTAQWMKSVLGELCTFQAGGAFPRHEQGHLSGDHPFIKVSDMTLSANGTRIIEANNWVSAETAAQMKLKLAPPGAVVFAKIGEGLKAERLRWLTVPTAMDNNMMAAIPNLAVVDSGFLLYLLESVHIAEWAQGSALPYLSQNVLADIPVQVPSLPEQRAIAATLGALDDKIESNQRQRALLRSLGYTHFLAACELGSSNAPLEKVAVSIARGVAPKYADHDPTAPRVINQRCIRDGWVSLVPSRRMVDREVPPAKRAFHGDILVNSTGTGTLGRVARWHGPPIFVDGHITVVRPDPSYAPPTITAYALLGRETDIVDLATGSTGQTELSPKRLAELDVALPSRAESEQLESVLLALESRSEQLATEAVRLTNLRDTLLPELLSGRLRTPAEES